MQLRSTVPVVNTDKQAGVERWNLEVVRVSAYVSLGPDWLIYFRFPMFTFVYHKSRNTTWKKIQEQRKKKQELETFKKQITLYKIVILETLFPTSQQLSEYRRNQN